MEIGFGKENEQMTFDDATRKVEVLSNDMSHSRYRFQEVSDDLLKTKEQLKITTDKLIEVKSKNSVLEEKCATNVVLQKDFQDLQAQIQIQEASLEKAL